MHIHYRLISDTCVVYPNICIQQMALFSKTPDTWEMQVLIEIIQWCVLVCKWCNHAMMHTTKLVIIQIMVVCASLCSVIDLHQTGFSLKELKE